ncbi:Rnf26 [Symbiodinium necroappetens]|uniref:Rnf26 protein n=1 Tax=Symbiodinium necroappetens TaxID=1628268 RepID=A0A812VD11_9DINO|nr:Rnf26 [Symbiodinium necroappetens]
MDTDGLTWTVLGDEVQSSLGDVKETVGPTDTYLYVVLAVLLLLALILGPRFVLQSLSRRAGQATRVVECGSCHHRQYVQANISSFVCEGCRRTNHVSCWVKPEDLLYCASGPIKFFQFQKAGRAFWREVSERESEPAPGVRDPTNEPSPAQTDLDPESLSNLGEESVVPRCVVCLDEPGCMVLLPCSHGAVCEACVTKIVQNQACGGAHCPHCRSNIGTVVKLRDFKGDMASGMELRIPMARP